MGMIIFDTSRNYTDYFWGERTSTLDWCEENYMTSRYLAEFWNTISSFAFVLSSIYMLWKCYNNYRQKRIMVMFLAVAIVGLGSVAFHATLKLSTQLLDELPMIYGTTIYLYLVVETDDKLKYGWKAPVLIILANVFITYSYIWMMNPVFHQISFGLIMVFNFTISARHMRRLPQGAPIRKTLNKLLISAFLGAVIGFGAWNFDNVCCSSLRQTRTLLGSPLNALLQMHAWWHIFTAYGCHCLAIFLVALRLELAGRRDYSLHFRHQIPYIEFNKAKSISYTYLNPNSSFIVLKMK